MCEETIEKNIFLEYQRCQQQKNNKISFLLFGKHKSPELKSHVRGERVRGSRGIILYFAESTMKSDEMIKGWEI
jgi:hypothetical protein